MWVYLKMKVPQDESDKAYQKELVKTVLDIEKAFKGSLNNSFIAILIKDLVESSERELKFPMAKVSW
jgi:hypothetical protein